MTDAHDPHAPRFAFRLNIRRPVDQDAYEVTLAVNFVTFDVDEVKAVPEEHRTFLRQWLMDHTTESRSQAMVDDLIVFQAPNTNQLFEHTIGMVCSNMANEIFKQLHWQTTSEEALAKELPVLKSNPRTTYSRPDSL